MKKTEKVDLGTYLGLDALRIGVIDDSAYFRRIAVTMLTAFGVRTVIEAATEAEGWSIVESWRPDLLLVDWNLGTGGNGASFVDRIRRHPDPAVSTLSLILVTAYNTRRHMLAAAELGANSLILKPISARVFYERLERFLVQRQLYERRGDRLVPLLRRPGTTVTETGVRIPVAPLRVPMKDRS